MNRRYISIFTLVFMLSLLTTTQAQVKIGVLPRLAPSELTKMFTPLANKISKEIGQPVELVIPKDFDTFMQMLKAGKFDYAYANPNVYVEARSSLGDKVEPLAIAVETGTGKSFTGCFLVKKGSTIKKITDLKGKKIIFVDEKSAGGYLSQIFSLKKSGLAKKDVTILSFANKHTNVALAVQNGVADAGGIRTADFAKIKVQVKIPDVEILTETEAIPNWPFFSLPNAKKDVTDKIKAAVLSISPKSAGSAILKDAKLDGFLPTSDADFNTMRQLSDAVKTF